MAAKVSNSEYEESPDLDDLTKNNVDQSSVFVLASKNGSSDQKINEIKSYSEISPNSQLLHELTESQGLNKTLSRKALVCTKNKSIEDALRWINELGAEEMEALSLDSDDNSSDCSANWEDCDEEIEYKMIFVINTEYSMGSGKIASQVGHAAIGLYKILTEDREKFSNCLQEWENSGEKKIALKVKNTHEILDIEKVAEKKDLATYLVVDAGRTQTPDGAVTALGIFGDEETVNEVTGHLKLL